MRKISLFLFIFTLFFSSPLSASAGEYQGQIVGYTYFFRARAEPFRVPINARSTQYRFNRVYDDVLNHFVDNSNLTSRNYRIVYYSISPSDKTIVDTDGTFIADFPSGASYSFWSTMSSVSFDIGQYNSVLTSLPLSDTKYITLTALNAEALSRGLYVSTLATFQYSGLDSYRGKYVQFEPYIYFVIQSTHPLDLSYLTAGVEGYLLQISNKLDTVNTNLINIINALTSSNSTINTNLIGIISAINNLSISGGGTTAVVGAIAETTAAIAALQQQIKDSTDQVDTAISEQTAALEQAVTTVKDSVDALIQKYEDEKAQAETEGNGRGERVVGMLTSFEADIDSKWGFIKFPTHVMERVVDVLSQGTHSRSYMADYDGVVGYTYDDTIGTIRPVIDHARAAQRRIGQGGVITFPAFTLTVPSYGEFKLWDDYDFDLGQLLDDLGPLLDMLHVMAGIILLYDAVSFTLSWIGDVFDMED